MSKKHFSFARIECNVENNKKGFPCKRWLGDIDTCTPGSIARFRCRDCKTLHVVEVIAKGIIKRSSEPIHAHLEYDPSMAVINDR